MPPVATPYNGAMSWARWAEAKQKGQLRDRETPLPPQPKPLQLGPPSLRHCVFRRPS